MLDFDRTSELKRRFLLTAVERNKNSQLRIRALQEIAALSIRPPTSPATSSARGSSRDERREGTKASAACVCREADRPPRPGERVDLAPGRVHAARGARGVRRAALAGDEAPARPARQLVRPCARAQRTQARAGLAHEDPRLQAGDPRRRGRPHPRGRGGAARRSHAPIAQARRAFARSCRGTSPGKGRRGRRRRNKRGAATRAPQSRSPARSHCSRAAARAPHRTARRRGRCGLHRPRTSRNPCG